MSSPDRDRPQPDAFDDARRQDIGLPNVSLGPHFEMHPVVFPAGAIIVLSLVGLAFFMDPDRLGTVFDNAKDWIGTSFGWLYVATLTGFLLFAAWLGLGRFGHVRLGTDDEKPEFPRVTWFAMLFSAGMGIGLVFWSVAEPIYHFNAAPPGFADGLDPSRLSMAVTIFHWGLHPWALYAIVALSLAYFSFRRGMPLGFRSLLHPIFGDRVFGRLGDAVDTLAVIATLVGVATSLGLGAKQVNAGLNFLFGVSVETGVQMLLIAGITAVATISVVLGLGTGIRRLSELNLGLASVLLVLVVFGGGVVAFLGATVENTGAYLQVLPFTSFRTGAFNEAGANWLNGWTVFYWAWWIAWSPFVGMFIARVSRGRTIREFVAGTLLVPTGVGILWLTAFGTTALTQHTSHLEADERIADASASGDTEAVANEALPSLPTYQVAELDDEGEPVRDAQGKIVTTEQPLTAVEYLNSPVVTQDREGLIAGLPTVLFALIDGIFESRFLSVLAAGIATLCIILFFVTSSDSASMVIDIIATGGNPDPPVGTRLFWAITEGVVAAALLWAGGLSALQAASITAALPFVVILILASVALFRALNTYEAPRNRTSPFMSGDDPSHR